MELSPEKIFEEIQGTPLSLQEDLFKNYAGLKISGVGSIYTLNDFDLTDLLEDSREKGVILLGMHTYTSNSISPPTIHCYANLNKDPELKLLRNRDLVNFSGKIKAVTATGIYVVNSIFSIKESVSSKSPNDVPINGKVSEFNLYKNPPKTIINNNYYDSQVHNGLGDNLNSGSRPKEWYEKPPGIIFITLIAGLLLAGIVFYLKWN